jgi:hypothetical protein
MYNNWYILCVLCSTPTLLTASRHNTHKMYQLYIRARFSKQPQQQLTSPTYNIDNTHMYIQLLTTITPTNIWLYTAVLARDTRSLILRITIVFTAPPSIED